jgi:hypothetical protein
VTEFNVSVFGVDTGVLAGTPECMALLAKLIQVAFHFVQQSFGFVGFVTHLITYHFIADLA